MTMKYFRITMMIVASSFLGSCASSYMSTNPSNVNYYSTVISEEKVTLSYKYDLLPKKYAKKEVNNNIKLVAVRIANNSDKDITVGKDFVFSYSNGSELNMVDNRSGYNSLKQTTAGYLGYLLLTPVALNTDDGRGKVSSTPIGIVLGPGLTLLNTLISSGSNGKFKKDLIENDISNKTISKGQTISGYIVYRGRGSEAIKLKFR